LPEQSVRRSKAFNQIITSVSAQRADLQQAALARYSVLKRANARKAVKKTE